MTSVNRSDTGDGAESVDAVDLSSAFGDAAASSLRGLLKRRSGGDGVVEETVPDADEPVAVHPGDAPAVEPRPPSRRRPRVVRVRERRNIDLLLLAATSMGPATGRELTELVREGSDGVFVLAVGTVYRELHRLEDDRLMQVTWNGGTRHYRLTPLGERVLASQRRECEAFSHGFGSMWKTVDASDRPE